mgnify:CR=1 FL=1
MVDILVRASDGKTVNIPKEVAEQYNITLFYHGAKSSIGVTAVQMLATDTKIQKGVVVKADNNNSGIVYVGKSASVTAGSADATDGFPLYPGDSVKLDVGNLNLVYLIGSAAGQKVFFIAD